MKNIILFILITLSSCSFVLESPGDLLSSQNTNMSVEAMNRAYPYWNMKPFEFRVNDLNAGTIGEGASESTDSEQNRKARILNIRSKEVVLERLNIIRFVVNTPEFADLLRTKQFYSSRNEGSVKLGDPLDSERLVKVVQKASFYSRIIKTKVISGAAAHASVDGFLYLASDAELANVSVKGSYVAFPNTHSWEGYNTPWIAEAFFHELLHNMGFSHRVNQDATYGMQSVFSKTYNNPKWQKKYKKQLAAFQYYTKKYSHYLRTDSLATKSKRFNDTDLFTADQTRSENTHNNETYNNKIEEVCVLYPDGTHKLVKMRNGRII